MKNKVLDVLICSYNEAESIPDLLDSFINQTVSLDKFNIMFIDNNSDDNTREIVESYQSKLTNLKFILEPRKGKSVALNTGYQFTTSEYVAQTDADCKVDSIWIENIFKLINEENPDLFGGPYFPYYNFTKPKWYKDQYNSYDKSPKRIILKKDEYLSGANMVWRRNIINELGGHNELLGITNQSLAGGEDTEMMVRARQSISNLKVIYDPSIVVYHLTKKKNFSIKHKLARSFVSGKRHSQVFIINQEQTNYTRLGILRATLLTIFRIIKTCSKGIFFRDKKIYPYYRNLIYEVVSSQFYALGNCYEILIKQFTMR